MTTAKKGQIAVNTQDIFPIIKKWLYSEHDIFIRELVANATDAITKRATLSRTQNREIPTGKIDILINKDKKTITLTDNGLGMTEEEVEKYIAQLAFSGAEEFVKKFDLKKEDQQNDIIGKFGLGFYSAFMVANKVEVDSLSMSENASPTHWECAGETDYIFSESTRKEVGTTITLHLNEESTEFLSEFRLSEILKKFCRFMPHQISVLDELREPTYPKKEDGSEDKTQPAIAPTPTIINGSSPLWKKDPTELKDEDYKNFYRELHPMDPEPLFWIHLKVDHPFTLEGILYFPKLDLKKPFNESHIKLFCRQVFVSENVKDIIPEFLSLLKGTIDSVDIPLNVSRSSLQGDPNIRKISNYIVKKVAEALKKLFKQDRARYEEIWDDIGLFVKYGVISDPKFSELMLERTIFKTRDRKFYTFNEYQEAIDSKYKEKLKNKVLYFEKDRSDMSLVSEVESWGIPVIEMDNYIDPHFTQQVEMKKSMEKEEERWQFSSIDNEYDSLLEPETTTEEDIKIKELFEEVLKTKDDNNKEVEVAKSTQNKKAAYLKVDAAMKRFEQMAKSMGNGGMDFPIKKTLMINPHGPLLKSIYKLHQKGDSKDLVNKLCHYVEDLAYISAEGLEGEKKENFIKRSEDIMQELSEKALAQ